MSLFTTGMKASYESAISMMHTSFARPILYWKTPQEIYLSQDTEYNPFYNKPPSTIEYVQSSGTISGRVLYAKDQRFDLAFNSPQDQQIRAGQDKGLVRIKLRKEDAPLLAEAVNIELDGLNFELDTSPRFHGLFDPKFITYYLKTKN